MSVVLDAGALIALDRGDRRIVGFIEAQLRSGATCSTHGGVVGQVWRGGGRQVRLLRVLRSVEVVPLGRALGQQAGALLAQAATSDVVDAALVCIARDGDTIITSDVGDIARLVQASGADLTIQRA